MTNDFIHQLTYISSASTKFTEDELRQLLIKARDKNSALQLTGMLLYVDGNFIQVLEGDKKVVNDLYDIILKDGRHRGIIKLLEKDISERNFPDWTMGFKSLTIEEASQLSGYKNLTTDILQTDSTNHPAVKLLKKFHKNNTGI